MSRSLVTLIALGILIAVSSVRAGTKTLIEWTFDKPGDMIGWTAGRGVTGLAVRDGCLTGRTVEQDPLVTGPLFEIPATPYQYVEIRMKSSASGQGELYWTNTTEEPYKGFRPDLAKRIEYRAGDFQVYRIFPFWQQEGKIIHIRLDPPENSEFAVDYIKIVSFDVGENKAVFFDFTKPGQDWTSVDALQAVTSGNGIVAIGPGDKLFISPKLDLDPAALPWLSLMAKSDGVNSALLDWVTDKFPGIREYTVWLKPDNKWHVYNLPMEAVSEWTGKISLLGVQVSLAQGQHVEIKFMGASAGPQGPAELDIRNFGLRDAIGRTGRSAVIQATVTNTGGETARVVKVILHTPSVWGFVTVGPRLPNRQKAGAPVLDKIVRTIPELNPGESSTVTWTVRARGVGEFKVSVDALALGVADTHVDATFRWYPAVDLPKASYVPEPKPVRGEFEVGMYYFPGWWTYSRWSVLDDYPERRPILGYYREGDPEVADWQIKWMVEHGVTFIVYDWYWSAGARQLEHGIHQGFFNAKYNDKIKFCLLWANHNGPKTSSAEDMVNVTKYWLDNYFLRDDYMKVDGKPVVVIFSPYRFTEDMGVEGVKAAFDKSREMARARGLNGIYFVSCASPNPGMLKQLEQEGYDALSGYNYPSAGDNGKWVAPYDDMVTGYRDIWNAIADNTKLRYIPVTEPGWDSRPWNGPGARIRTGKTPEKFKTMLQYAKEFVEKRTPDAKPKMVLIEAWNEFGEGDYVEPHQEFGFGHVDAIREVFTDAPKEHIDLVPQDVGLGPYELEKPKPVTSWEFDDPSLPGWDAAQNVGDVKVQNGCLTAVSSGNDPAFASQVINIDVRRMRSVEIRMRVDKGKIGQLFWAGRGQGTSEAASLRFDLIADGEFHVYRLDLGSSPAWRSRITSLRLDPTDAAGAHIEVDYIRLQPVP